MKEIKTIISKMKQISLMRPMGLIGLIRPISLIGLIILCCLTSCSNSDDVDEQNTVAGFEIGGVSGYSAYFEESRDIQATRSDEGLTRAWAIPTGYTAYENGAQTIAVAFTKNGENPEVGPDPGSPKSMLGHFFYIEGKWRTNVNFAASTTYHLYGFIPNVPSIKYSITDLQPAVDDDDDGVEGTDVKYDGFSAGAKMTLKDVPTVMDNDFCVVIGAKHGTDKEHDSGLRMGDFDFTSTQGSDGKDYFFLLFDHLYSSVCVNIKVYSDYAEMRTIKLKSLKLCTKVGDDKTTEYTDVTINVHRTDGSDPTESPIAEPTFTPAGDEIGDDGMEFWSDGAGQELTTSYQPFIGHFMPNGITHLNLTSTYDVYDTKGNLIRKDCKVTNYMELKDLITGQVSTKRGKRYIINLTIKPTYLYMLSDPDLDSPTVVVN